MTRTRRRLNARIDSVASLQAKVVKALGESGASTISDVQRATGGSYHPVHTALKALKAKGFVKAHGSKVTRAGPTPAYWLTRQGIGEALVQGAKAETVLQFCTDYGADAFSLAFARLCDEKPTEMKHIMEAGFLPHIVLPLMEDLIAVLPAAHAILKDNPNILGAEGAQKYPRLQTILSMLPSLEIDWSAFGLPP